MRQVNGREEDVVLTGPLVFGDGGDEGHEAGTAEELGDEDGGVALRFGGFNPLQTCSENTCFAAALAKNTATVATHLSLSLSLSRLNELQFFISNLVLGFDDDLVERDKNVDLASWQLAKGKERERGYILGLK